MEAYIKEKHMLYKVEAGKITSVNTERRSFKVLKSMPQVTAHLVEIIGKDEFDNAFKEIQV